MARKASLANTFATAVGVTTQAIDVTSLSIASGDLVLVFLVTPNKTASRAADAVTLTPNVTTGGPFAKDVGIYSDGGRDVNAHALHYVANGADTSITIGGILASTPVYNYVIWVESGIDTTTPLDVSITTATGIATDRPDPAAITPVTSSARIIAAYFGAEFAAPSAWSTPANVGNFISFLAGASTTWGQIAAGDATWTSGAFDPAAVTAGGNNGASDSWGAITYALRPTVGATTHTYSASGGLQTGGSATLAKTKAVIASGGLQLAGTGARTKTKSATASGGMQFAGAVATAKIKAATVSGGALFAGAATTLFSVFAPPPPSGWQYLDPSSVTFTDADGSSATWTDTEPTAATWA